MIGRFTPFLRASNAPATTSSPRAFRLRGAGSHREEGGFTRGRQPPIATLVRSHNAVSTFRRNVMNSTLSRARRIVGSALAIALVATLVPAGAASAHTKPKKPQHQIKKVTKKPQHKVKNVIVLISDGMGYNQLAAGDLYTDGKLGTQGYEKFPFRAGMSTFAHPSVGGGYDPAQAWGSFDYVKMNPTDSAAAATAMSTGVQDVQRRHRRRRQRQPDQARSRVRRGARQGDRRHLDRRVQPRHPGRLRRPQPLAQRLRGNRQRDAQGVGRRRHHGRRQSDVHRQRCPPARR